ncbi:hypothetical protein GGR53DRAFT_180351 [Hypoxylon sp. FL1150]|nr:hypothetical protein GGR53DRAFT_180351 [Hypoxylon sp. FL1150]
MVWGSEPVAENQPPRPIKDLPDQEIEIEMKNAIGGYVKTPSVELLNGLLKELKSEYEGDHTILLRKNLGDFLNKHDDELQFDITPTREAKHVILQFMIDRIPSSSLGFKLSELDARRETLLETAADQGRWKCVALLLAKVDNSQPGNERIYEGLAPYPRSSVRREMLDLLVFKEYCRLGPEEFASITQRAHPMNKNTPEYKSGSIHELQRNPESWIPLVTPAFERTTWIHVPSTNGLAIMAIFRVLANQYSTEVADKIMRIFYDHFRLSTITPGDPHLKYRDVSCELANMRKFPSTQEGHVIVFPYLTLSTIGRHEAARAQHDQVLGGFFPQVTRLEYAISDFIHLGRTLDEAYYPGLSSRNLELRNDDQVVSRRFKHKDKETPILLVPHLWLWRVGNIIISASPTTHSSELFQEWYYGVQERREAEWKLQLSSDSARDQVCFILADHISGFGREYFAEGIKYPATLDIFETSVVSVLSEATRYMNSRNPGSLNYWKEKRLLHALSDIRSELSMIQYFINQQGEVLDELTKQLDLRKILTKAAGDVQKYQRRIKKIDSDAEKIEKTVHDMLNLKRTYASVKDAHSSVMLSTAVIGFTVITIIFAPLAFLTALFALKIDGFEKLQVNVTDGTYNSSYMIGIFVGTEILTISLTISVVVISLWWMKTWSWGVEDAKKLLETYGIE